MTPGVITVTVCVRCAQPRKIKSPTSRGSEVVAVAPSSYICAVLILAVAGPVPPTVLIKFNRGASRLLVYKQRGSDLISDIGASIYL